MEQITPQALVLAAGACFVAGYLVINQVILRLSLFLGSALYLWYYFVAADQPLWDAIVMSLLMLVANIIGLLGLWLQGQIWIVPRRHRDLYMMFQSLPPGDFRNLIRHAQRITMPERQCLTREGERQTRLYFRNQGRA